MIGIVSRSVVAGLIGLVAFGGCGERGPVDPAQVVVASVDDRAITWGEVERHFAENLLDVAGPDLEPGENDQIKSRLLDGLIDECVLLAEAERRGLSVDERTLTLYLELQRDPEAERFDVTPVDRELTRRRLTIEALLASVAAALPPVEDEELRAYLYENRDVLMPERRLVLRSLRFATRSQAQGVFDAIRRKRQTFDEAVATSEGASEQGIPLEVSWRVLSEEVRAVLEPLAAGQISKPLEYHGQFYVFRVEAWLGAASQVEGELLERARRDLEGERQRWAGEALVRQLRDRARISIQPGRLPFRYTRGSSDRDDDPS